MVQILLIIQLNKEEIMLHINKFKFGLEEKRNLRSITKKNIDDINFNLIRFPFGEISKKETEILATIGPKSCSINSINNISKFTNYFRINGSHNSMEWHIKISKRRAYMSFIRAITSAIRMAVAGNPRWTDSKIIGKFWDYRPFSRVVRGRQAFLDVEDYITINRIEGLGLPKTQARLLMGHIQNRRKIFRSKSAGGNVEIALLC